MNIAMWSGPRNLSTALMYSFAARADCEVVDEPFYGAYLRETGLEHPMRAEILATMPESAGEIAADLSRPRDGLFYQKHMTHHMVDSIPRDWMSGAKHAFLIRHPARVIASYAAKREAVVLSDLGFEEQLSLFQQAQQSGEAPVVVDSHDIRRAPEETLRKLCAALGIDWDPAMLHWPKGGNPADGVWAKHWYGAVHGSTQFAAPEGNLPLLEPHLQPICDAAMPLYDAIADHRI